MFGSFDLSHAKPLQNKKLDRKLSAYIIIEPYIGHHRLVQRVRRYTDSVKCTETLGDLAQVSEQLSHH